MASIEGTQHPGELLARREFARFNHHVSSKGWRPRLATTVPGWASGIHDCVGATRCMVKDLASSTHAVVVLEIGRTARADGKDHVGAQ